MSSLDDIYIPPTPAEERDTLRAEVERLRGLLRDVYGSGVQLPAEPPALTYTTVQIDADLWSQLRKEFGQ